MMPPTTILILLASCQHNLYDLYLLLRVNRDKFL